MKRWKQRTWIKFTAVALSLSLIAAAAALVLSGTGVAWSGWAQAVSRPFSRLAAAVTGWAGPGGGLSPGGGGPLQAENAALEEQVAQLQAAARAGELAQGENARLRALLDWPETGQDLTLTPAWVIARTPDNWQGVVTIDQGRDQGVLPGQCVVDHCRALVGQVKEAGESWATVTLVTDGDFQLAGQGSRWGTLGALSGDLALLPQGELAFTCLTQADPRPRRGRRWSPSPPGRAIPPACWRAPWTGWRPTPGASPRTAVLTPAADLANLGQVFVVTAFEGGAVNGEVPPGPGHRPGLFAGGLGAGVVPPLGGAAPGSSPPWPAWWGTEEGPAWGGGLWTAGGRFVRPGGGLLPFQMALLTLAGGAFRGSFPPNGLLLGKMAGQPGHPNGDGGPAGAGPRPGGGGAAGPPGHRRAGAPPRRGGVSGGVSPHPAEKAPGAAPGRRALLDGARGEPCRVGPGGPGARHRYAVPLGRAQAQPCGVGPGACPRSWVPYRRWGPLTHFGARRPGGCPAGGLHFSCEKARTERVARGCRPWTPVFKAARWALAPSLAIECAAGRQRVSYRGPCAPGPDLETFFFGENFFLTGSCLCGNIQSEK